MVWMKNKMISRKYHLYPTEELLKNLGLNMNDPKNTSYQDTFTGISSRKRENLITGEISYKNYKEDQESVVTYEFDRWAKFIDGVEIYLDRIAEPLEYILLTVKSNRNLEDILEILLQRKFTFQEAEVEIKNGKHILPLHSRFFIRVRLTANYYLYDEKDPLTEEETKEHLRSLEWTPLSKYYSWFASEILDIFDCHHYAGSTVEDIYTTLKRCYKHVQNDDYTVGVGDDW